MTSLKLNTVYAYSGGVLTETDETPATLDAFRDEADGIAYLSGIPADYKFGTALQDNNRDDNIFTEVLDLDEASFALRFVTSALNNPYRFILLPVQHEKTDEELGYTFSWYLPN